METYSSQERTLKNIPFQNIYLCSILCALALLFGAASLSQYQTPYTSGPMSDLSIPWVVDNVGIRTPLSATNFIERTFTALFASRFEIAVSGGALGLAALIVYLFGRARGAIKKGGRLFLALNVIFFLSALYIIFCIRWWGYG